MKMAQLFKKNETVVAPFYKNGVTLQWFTLKFASADLTAKLDADEAGFIAGTYTVITAKSPVAKALENIQARVSIEVIGTVQYNISGYSSATTLVIGVAALGGNFPTDDYKTGGAQAMNDYLQYLVRDGKTYQGFAMSGVTVEDDVYGLAL